MSELVTWLRAQLDEDEADARRRYFHTDECYRFLDPGGGCSCDYSDRVLAEVEAKRRILDLHPPVQRGWIYQGKPPERVPNMQCSICHTDHDPGGTSYDCPHGGHEYPCLTIRLLALPYADRPGYQEAWRV